MMAVFHVKHPTPKHVENSIRGIRRAKRRGFTEIDLDMLITSDGFVVGCHWPRPMVHDGFRDPKRKLARDTSVARMTLAEVQRLRAFPGYKIQRIETLLHECARLGIGAVLEPKADPRFAHDGVWQHLAKVADDCGAHVRVYGFSLQNIDAAKRNGFKAKEL